MKRGTRDSGGRRTASRSLALAALAAAGFLLVAGGLPHRGPAGDLAPGAAAARAADVAPEKSVGADDVFHGDARNWSKPAEVDADAVFAEIDEYKKIVAKKLDTSDPEYGVLLTKARKRFRKALCLAAKDGGYDLIAKVGSVKGVENVPDITQDVIKKL